MGEKAPLVMVICKIYNHHVYILQVLIVMTVYSTVHLYIALLLQIVTEVKQRPRLYIMYYTHTRTQTYVYKYYYSKMPQYIRYYV